MADDKAHESPDSGGQSDTGDDGDGEDTPDYLSEPAGDYSYSFNEETGEKERRED